MADQITEAFLRWLVEGMTQPERQNWLEYIRWSLQEGNIASNQIQFGATLQHMDLFAEVLKERIERGVEESGSPLVRVEVDLHARMTIPGTLGTDATEVLSERGWRRALEMAFSQENPLGDRKVHFRSVGVVEGASETRADEIRTGTVRDIASTEAEYVWRDKKVFAKCPQCERDDTVAPIAVGEWGCGNCGWQGGDEYTPSFWMMVKWRNRLAAIQRKGKEVSYAICPECGDDTHLHLADFGQWSCGNCGWCYPLDAAPGAMQVFTLTSRTPRKDGET